MCFHLTSNDTKRRKNRPHVEKSTLHVTHVRFFSNESHIRFLFTLNYLCFVCTFSIEVRKSVEKLMKFYLLRPTYHFYVIWSHSSTLQATHQVGHSKLRVWKKTTFISQWPMLKLMLFFHIQWITNSFKLSVCAYVCVFFPFNV